MLLSGLLVTAALLLANLASPPGQWEWRRATTPSTANAEGLRLAGTIACKVVANGETYLGAVRDGECRYYETRTTETKTASAPNYEFLGAKGGAVNLQAVTLPPYGVPRGVVRAASGDSGRVLCSAGSLGWLYRDECRVYRQAVDGRDGRVSIFITPATGFVDLPSLWRDPATIGGSTNGTKFCRARITSSGPKMAPGIFSNDAGGTCSFVVGVSTSGAVTFAKTTDKARFTVLVDSTNSSERLIPWGVDRNARLRAGIVGSEPAFACFKSNTKGVYFRGTCVTPPASGSGAGTVLPGTVSETPDGITLLTVFGDTAR